MYTPIFYERGYFNMVARKDRHFIKKLIREELVKQLKKTAFNTEYTPTDDEKAKAENNK